MKHRYTALITVLSLFFISTLHTGAQFGDETRTETRVLSASLTGSDLQHRESLAVSGDIALVGLRGTGTEEVSVVEISTGTVLGSLVSDDWQSGDQFGWAVSAAGDVAIVSAIKAGGIGAVYVFDIPTRTQTYKLTPSNGAAGDNFGYSVSVVETLLGGTRAVISSYPFDGGTTPVHGAAYVFDVDNGTELHQLVLDPEENGDDFGYTVEMTPMNNGYPLVGAPGDNGNRGAVYGFGDTGEQFAKYLAPDPEAGDRYGADVDFGDNTFVIGAPGGNAVYVYNNYEVALQKTWVTTDSNFGETVVVDGTRALIANPADQTVRLYELTTGQLLTTLSPSVSGTDFGGQIALAGNTAVIAKAGSLSSGVYVYEGLPTGRLLADDFEDQTGYPYTGFGFSVDLDVANNRALVSAPEYDNASDVSTGAVYLIDTSTGEQLFKLTPSDGASGDGFGTGIAIDGNWAVVGAPRKNSYTGAVYVYNTTTGQEVYKLTPSSSANPVYIGSTVAVQGNQAFVLAEDDDVTSIYIFDLTTGQQTDRVVTGRPIGSRPLAVHGSKMVFTSANNTVSLYDLNTSQVLFTVSNSGDNVELNDTHIIVGNASSQYAVIYDITDGTELFTIQPDDLENLDSFGNAVALSETTAWVGAPAHDYSNSPFNSSDIEDVGAVYAFDLATGEQIAKLIPLNITSYDDKRFGTDIAVDGDALIVGATADDYMISGVTFTSSAGGAYLYQLEDEVYTNLQAQTLDAPTMVPGSFDVSFSVTNTGSTAANDFCVGVAIHQYGWDAVPVATLTYNELAPGATITETVTVDVPDAIRATLREYNPPEGTGEFDTRYYKLEVTANCNYAFDELTLSDNTLTTDLEIVPWDADANGVVDEADAAYINARLGLTTAETEAQADVNGDGSITSVDITEILNRLGYTLP